MNEGWPVTPPEVSGPLLDTVGNHEVKLALGGLYLWKSQPYPNWRSFLAFAEDYGSTPAFAKEGSLARMCQRHFGGAAGILAEDSEGLRPRADYRLERLALLGLLSDWSVRWRNFSVQHIYGATSQSVPYGVRAPRQSPSIRQIMYETVYRHEAAQLPLSVFQLGEALGGDQEAANRHVRRLVETGVLDKESIRDIDYTVRIIDEPSRIRPRADSTPAIQAFHRAINLHGPGLTTIRQLVKFVEASQPGLDITEFNRRIRAQLLRGDFKSLELVTERRRGQGSGTTIRFADAARRPIRELVEGMGHLQVEEGVEYYALRCQQAVRNKAVFRFLLNKGIDHSRKGPNNTSPEDKQHIQALTKAHPEGLDLQTARQLLTEQQPDTLWADAKIRAHLAELVTKGELYVQKRQKDPFTKVMINVYYPNSNGDVPAPSEG